MAITITNIAAMSAQRHLNATTSATMQAMERLASGKRINSAKDDPAGFAIASRMTSQINGMNQGARNAMDAISFAQTAEGGLASMEDMLQRIRTLAVQSSNASNSPMDRQAIQEEVNQLLQQLDYTARSLNFNGRKILDGSTPNNIFQVGANAGETIGFTSNSFLTSQYGNYRVRQTLNGISDTTNVTGGTIRIAGAVGKATCRVSAGSSAKDIADNINFFSGKTGVSASARTEVNLNFTPGSSGSLQLATDEGKSVTIAFSTGDSGNPAKDLTEAAHAINAQSGKTGITAQVDTENGGIILTHEKGSDIIITNTSEAAEMTVANYGPGGKPNPTPTTLNAGDTGVMNGAITYNSSQSFSVTDDSGLNSTGGTTAVSRLQSVSVIDLSTFGGAQDAIWIADAAINAVVREQTRYGALQSRLGYTIEFLEISSENLSAARSRIEDADYAAETAALARASILQQAALAMLAYANDMQSNLIMTLLESIRRN